MSRVPSMDTKIVTKEDATKKLHNQGELRRTTTNCGKKGNMLRDCWSKKKFVESSAESSNMEMEEEWDVEEICVIEEDELALMAMMGKHIDYKND